MSRLMTPLQLRGVTLRNRIGMSPMCMYSCRDGMATDWHLVHLGARAVGGAGLVIAEATGVTPEGRISPDDLGLWKDQQIEPLARVTAFVRDQGSVPGIQLAHAGRKASTWALAKGDGAVPKTDGGWQVVAPSAVSFADHYPHPVALTQDGIDAVITSFADAARRAVTAGFRLVELHAAHGYLLHQFLSPLSNRRTDQYGGSFENRIRLPMAVVEEVRAALPADLPLVVRVSATDWSDADDSWTLDQAIELCRHLRDAGVDLIDVSSGGTLLTAAIPVAPGYQSDFAARIRGAVGVPVSTVGMMTHPAQAEHALTSGQADMILIGRELLRDPYWPMHAAAALDEPTSWPTQYLRAAPRHSTRRTAQNDPD